MSVEQIAREVYDLTIDTGVQEKIELLDKLSPETVGHSVRVSSGAMRVSLELLGLSDDQVREIGFCALTHDIGKIQVAELVNLKRQLRPEEYAVVSRHTIYGEALLTDLSEEQTDQSSRDLLLTASMVARDHHNPISSSSPKESITALIVSADRDDATCGVQRSYMSDEVFHGFRNRDPADAIGPLDLSANGGRVPLLFGVSASQILRSLAIYRGSSLPGLAAMAS